MNDAGTNEAALDHAWKWWEYHASQRMTMIRFYLIAAGGIAAGLGFLFAAHENVLACLVSAIGVITSLAFKRLDKRVADLVKVGEDALSVEQEKFGAPPFEMCRRADEKPNGARFYSYRENFALLFYVLAFGFAITALISFGRAAQPYSALICRHL